MATQIQSQVPSSSQSQLGQSQITQPTIKFKDCLLVTRHQLLGKQEEDINRICEKITKITTLPNDINELKKLVDFYDAVLGVVPLPFQVQILQLGKSVILFYMESLGVAQSKSEAEEMLKKSGLEGVILPPAREGEPYRVSAYRGLLRVKEIKVDDEFIIKH